MAFLVQYRYCNTRGDYVLQTSDFETDIVYIYHCFNAAPSAFISGAYTGFKKFFNAEHAEFSLRLCLIIIQEKGNILSKLSKIQPSADQFAR